MCHGSTGTVDQFVHPHIQVDAIRSQWRNGHWLTFHGEKQMSHLILVRKQAAAKNKRAAFAAALVRKQFANSNERV